MNRTTIKIGQESKRALRLAGFRRSRVSEVKHRISIRLIEPISADFAVLVGDAIRNLRSSLNQVADQLAVQHSGPLTEDAERMTELPIRISGAQFDDWATSKNKQTKLRRLGDLREAGFQTIRSEQPFAFAERLRRSADDRGTTPLADRSRLRGTTMLASSSTGLQAPTPTSVGGHACP